MNEDQETLERIRALVDEEHALRSGSHPVPKERLDELEVMLDQCWDLLRQRRARREFGGDESFSGARDADTVEDYLQ